MHEHGMTRRELMVGIGAGAGAALALPSLTAAAAPITNHVPAWGGDYFQALGATIPGLTYVGIDATAFHTYRYDTDQGRRLDATSGVGIQTNSKRLATPLMLPVDSVIHQINVAYQGSPIVEVFKRDFTVTTPTWTPDQFQQTAPVQGGAGVKTHTFNLATPITIGAAASYSLQLFCGVADSVYGITIGYLPPTAGFVPFPGATPRVYDSRTGDGKLGFQQERTINLGNPGVRGALFNLTVTETEGSGFVAAFAGNVTYPGNSSINYFGANQNLANGVVAQLAPDGTIKIRGGGPAGRAHVIIDRLGWFI